MRHDLAICAIIKNEGRYLAEWIAFHAVLGCSKFFLFDDGSSDDTAAVAAPYVRSGLVALTPWAERPPQLSAYAHVLRQRIERRDVRWCAFIDLDEFLVPAEGASLPAALEPFADCAAVGVHWLTFGSGGHVERPDGLVIESYTRRLPEQASVNQHYKSIVNVERIRDGRPINAHAFHLLGGATRNTRRARYSPRLVLGDWRRMSRAKLEALHIRDGVLEKAGKATHGCISHQGLRLHHYFSKSHEDWQARIGRGDVDSGAYPADKARLFDRYDRDNVEDATAARFADAVRARMAAARRSALEHT
jgi:hypothetical protein